MKRRAAIRNIGLATAGLTVSNRIWPSSKLKSQHIITLSFDDGFECVITQGLPVLKEFGVPATLFVVGGILKNTNFVPWYVEVKHLLRRAEKKTIEFNGIK